MTHLYHIRHGLTRMNVDGKISGRTDTPLVDEGRKQAKKTGKQARDLGIEYIICSPLQRAHETAQIVSKEIGYPENKIEVNPLFIERDFGIMEGQPYQRDINYDGIIDAEPTHVFLARAKQAVEYLHSLPYNKILVVSHGATGRALRHHLVKDQPFNFPIKYKNAELVEWIIT